MRWLLRLLQNIACGQGEGVEGKGKGKGKGKDD
jgi:hypothetical protein